MLEGVHMFRRHHFSGTIPSAVLDDSEAGRIPLTSCAKTKGWLSRTASIVQDSSPYHVKRDDTQIQATIRGKALSQAIEAHVNAMTVMVDEP